MMSDAVAFYLREILFKILRRFSVERGNRTRQISINRKIRRLGKHLNREEVQLCLNSHLILREYQQGCLMRLPRIVIFAPL